MDYEKKYKEALERARAKYAKKDQPIHQDLVDIFPEIAESEDEQHRKWILEYLYDGLRKSDEQFKDHFKAAIAWLEKQAEQKSIVIPKFKVGDIIKDTEDGEVFTIRTITKDKYIYTDDSFDWIKDQDEYELVEQKPAWSEKYIADVFEKVGLARIAREQGYDALTEALQSAMIELAKYSVVSQSKQEWSEEDYELEEFAKIVRGNLTGISKAVQKLFEAKYLQLTGNKMYGGFKD